jgi:hypothetical protein
VFTRRGIYTSPQLFIDGFSAALWVAAGLSALGMIAAALSPGRATTTRVAEVRGGGRLNLCVERVGGG